MSLIHKGLCSIGGLYAEECRQGLFKAADFIITESEEGSNTPNLITLDMRLNVNWRYDKEFRLSGSLYQQKSSADYLYWGKESRF